MEIHIKSKNMDLTDGIRNHVEEKISELEKFITEPIDATQAWVEVGKSTNHHRKGEIFEAAIDIKTPTNHFRAKEETEDLYMSINQSIDELKREIRKDKEKTITKSRKRSRLWKKFKNLIGNRPNDEY